MALSSNQKQEQFKVIESGVRLGKGGMGDLFFIGNHVIIACFLKLCVTLK